MKNYKVALREEHKKVRDEARHNRASKWGSKSKYYIAFVSRRRKIKGKRFGRVFQVYIDPVGKDLDSNTRVFDSTEAYELTREQVNEINALKTSTCLDILTSPVNQVQFRYIPRDVLRAIRRIVRRDGGKVLVK